jgi:hypothetical protein
MRLAGPLPTGCPGRSEPGGVRAARDRLRTSSGSGPVMGVALKRTLVLTGALEQRTPPQRVTLDPARAADHVLARLRNWGYL